MQYSIGKVDTGLHLNSYYSTIYVMRGTSKVLIFPPSDAEKLYLANPKKVQRLLKKWEDERTGKTEDEEVEEPLDEEEKEEEKKVRNDKKKFDDKKVKVCKGKHCKVDVEPEEEEEEQEEIIELDFKEETAEERYKRLREEEQEAQGIKLTNH